MLPDMGGLARPRHTFSEYLRLERENPQTKHEFLDGLVWAMAGGTPEHSAVAANVIGLVAAALRGKPCQVYTSDLRVRVVATGLGTYPDVTVICGRLETDPEDSKGQTAINPTVIVEVLSPSTEDYDRGEKLAHYKTIESLEEIVLVAHDEHRVEVWRRRDERWSLDLSKGEDTVHLASIDCELPLPEVYRDPLAG